VTAAGCKRVLVWNPMQRYQRVSSATGYRAGSGVGQARPQPYRINPFEFGGVTKQKMQHLIDGRMFSEAKFRPGSRRTSLLNTNRGKKAKTLCEYSKRNRTMKLKLLVNTKARRSLPSLEMDSALCSSRSQGHRCGRIQHLCRHLIIGRG
jgi:hypothetical protein